MSEVKTPASAETYKFKTEKGEVTISFTDDSEKPEFVIVGPKEIISKAIGGIGEENETEAWATEKDLKTEAQRMFAILEIMKVINK